MLLLLFFAMGALLGGALIGLWMRAKLARLEAAQEFSQAASAKLGDTFQALADASLRANQGAFLEAAKSTLEGVRAEMTGDLRLRQTAIEGVVQPLGDSLGRLESKVTELERAREKVFGSLDQQIQSLARETVTLSTALRSPHVRGRWGETTLRRVAELSGMVKNCDFCEQATLQAENGRLRPDMVVNLPGQRSLAVDAKVPLTAYLDAMGAQDEATRRAHLQRHAQQISEHARQLSSKQYWAQFQPAPEFVVLFLPGDQFFGAALEMNPSLLDEAVARKVLIATPSTLIAVLKGISHGWNQEKLAESAEEIRRVAGEFYDRLLTVFENFADTGRQIEKTVEVYNRSVGSWDSRLTPSLRRLRELGIGGKDAPLLEPVDITTRRPRAIGS